MPGIEQLVVWAILASAAGYLGWSLYGFFRRTPTGCGSACSRCPKQDASPQSLPLVTLDVSLPAGQTRKQ